MSRILDRDQFVLDALVAQFLGHHGGLLIGNVRVFGPVYQEGWRVLSRNIANRAKRIERLRLLVGIMAGHFFRPQSLLPAIEVKARAVVLPLTLGENGTAHGFVCFLFRNRWHLGVEGIGAAIPGAG